MSENLVIQRTRQAEVITTIEGLGVAIESQVVGNAEMLTCRRGKGVINIRIAQPSDWAEAPVLRDHAIAVVMVGSLLHRSEARILREDVVAACAPYVVTLDELVARARAAAGTPE